MEKAKKLPSGTWRIRAYDSDGKRVSFTGETKADVEAKAAEFIAVRKRRKTTGYTVGEAIERYITSKEAVLSPSTVRGYKRQLVYYDDIKHIKIKYLTNEDVQTFISNLSANVSPKSVRNIYGLLRSSLSFFQPDIKYRVTLPALQKKRPVSPSEGDVRLLLDNATPQLRKCIMLGMRGLRRGEICALKYEDIIDGIAHIHADMVKDISGNWIYKEYPKTEGSDRFVKVPDLGDGEGFIISWTPDSVTKRFIELRNSLGLTITFHQLRHFFCSEGVLLNIPDIYLADMGGWGRGSSVMKSIYQNNIVEMSKYYQDMLEDKMRQIENS